MGRATPLLARRYSRRASFARLLDIRTHGVRGCCAVRVPGCGGAQRLAGWLAGWLAPPLAPARPAAAALALRGRAAKTNAAGAGLQPPRGARATAARADSPGLRGLAAGWLPRSGG
eukprot:scaffold600_cov385-Prasinococcus_capsulatus_cf.AAC.17